ncbi:uncharacterized protein OCT59_013268 [Rhizophagus irregularis]|nr:hypothetical protein GLOIN_2v1487297 [Rhizophagus irregularis DAOM 181602=DAOM 197198]EXX75051.1 hypothetical protein RirG_045290 [Rhizophagus irregularis DAOM 197198w]POG60102.1 hypothetical protein GLOIN_2v1487297 [Rhizophagus irregularis DAOM 181602=DAOM 197198]UZO20858.1 hypothetical protein OCT59_013268 [Rhizophagus irregularis]|eukprot:XP_025166968.1 hypothetical protein GLOIN_2v1487297 [Rhizophagus irregularis DAOM 181602=DAOM 197198]
MDDHFVYIKVADLESTNDHLYQQDPAEWLNYKYGRPVVDHALFHAVRLDSSVTSDIQALLARNNVVMSRYFIQRLLTYFGNYDQKLIELKIELKVECSMNQVNFDRTREKKLRASGASNLSLSIYTKLINKAFNISKVPELAIKANNTELILFLSAGPLVIDYVPQRLFQNIYYIEELILNKKFITFPPRLKLTYKNTMEEYPPKDGYENNRQLNVIARAIIIHPDLINIWKNIGYYEICSDVNDLVIRGVLLILFPSTPPNDWECPDVNTVVTRLKKFTDLGFKLTNNVINDILRLFEHRLNEIGDLLMNSFQQIRNEPKTVIVSSCINNLNNLERNRNILKFLNGEN